LVILVDSSVWIDHFRDAAAEPVLRLRALIEREPLLIGDLVLCKVHQGVRSDAEARLVERRLGNSPANPLSDLVLCV
jgi:predicted nucleic acid-binding protein